MCINPKPRTKKEKNIGLYFIKVPYFRLGTAERFFKDLSKMNYSYRQYNFWSSLKMGNSFQKSVKWIHLQKNLLPIIFAHIFSNKDFPIPSTSTILDAQSNSR